MIRLGAVDIDTDDAFPVRLVPGIFKRRSRLQREPSRVRVRVRVWVRHLQREPGRRGAGLLGNDNQVLGALGGVLALQEDLGRRGWNETRAVGQRRFGFWVGWGGPALSASMSISSRLASLFSA